jgi:amino acid transporter
LGQGWLKQSAAVSSVTVMGSTNSAGGGTVFVSILSTITMLLFGKRPDALLMLVISVASCFLLAYIIASVDLIVLRKKYLNYSRP